MYLKVLVVLVPWGCCKKYHRPGGLHKRALFSQSWRPMSQIKVWAGLHSLCRCQGRIHPGFSKASGSSLASVSTMLVFPWCFPVVSSLCPDFPMNKDTSHWIRATVLQYDFILKLVTTAMTLLPRSHSGILETRCSRYELLRKPFNP